MGGETRGVVRKKYNGTGLSPRGRGNLRRLGAKVSLTGSIPAWAGKPRAGSRPGADIEVYPRVGGET